MYQHVLRIANIGQLCGAPHRNLSAGDLPQLLVPAHSVRMIERLLTFFVILGFAVPALAQAQGKPDSAWLREFPRTDFAKTSIAYSEIITDGPRRDQIPPIHDPKYIRAADDKDLGPLEPVLSVIIGDDARAYPLRILLWHEIVNETIGGVPVLVSYCPLCNSGLVFDRRVGGRTLKFGNTGRIRHFDMVMYDLETESWWQQFLGQAIIGELTGRQMKLVPARLESLARFIERAPDGKLLVPNNAGARPYGATPYEYMDSSAPPVFARYKLPRGVSSMDRVVVIGNQAWPVKLVAARKSVRAGDLVLTWVPGQNSIHDQRRISKGRDVGNIIVQKSRGGRLVDVPYDVAFAFAFKAFRPDGTLHLN